MKQNNALQNLIDRGGPIILDGGLATQLEAQGYDLNSSLWSAELLLNNPQAITDAHLAYLNAGAQIITSASYQASIQGLMSKGLSEDDAKKLINFSIELAEQAVESYLNANTESNKPLIAASVGPYGAYLADGSEYKGNYGVSDKVLKAFHFERLKVLDQSNADILACETIPSYQEARILAEVLVDIQTPVWLSFSCCDGQHLNDETKIEKVLRLFKDHHKVMALGVNCTAPQYISELIQRIKSAALNKTIIIYPNSGEIYDAISKTWQSIADPIDYAQAAKAWHNQGAQIIGGCCRIGPRQIKELKNGFNKL